MNVTKPEYKTGYEKARSGGLRRKLIAGVSSVVQTVIFNRATLNGMAEDIRALYRDLGAGVFALDPGEIVLDQANLPKWLSVAQYNKFKDVIGDLYTAVAHGFPSPITLMRLKVSNRFGLNTDYKGTRINKGLRITQKEYLNLPNSQKVLYKKVETRSGVYYYRSEAITKTARRAVSVIRQPTVGIRVAPAGRWVEVG